jgi:Flp pilus assembly protein TadD
VRSGGAARRAPQTTLPSLESTDPALSSALLALTIRDDAAAERRVAERYLQLGVLDLASDHYARACRLNPADAVAYDGLARIWRDWGFPALGLGDANRAVYYAPNWAPAYNTLGTLLTELGHRAEARGAYERAIAVDPRAAYAMSNLCYLSLLDGASSAAIEACSAALAIDPNLTAARLNMARARAAGGY